MTAGSERVWLEGGTERDYFEGLRRDDRFAGLNGPYSTLVVDPPWKYEQGGPTTGFAPLRPPPYSMMTVAEITALPVRGIAAADSHLYLWTTNRYLRDAHDIAKAWGFKPSQTLTWCKPPQGIGPGGAFSNTTEFILYCRRGSLPYQDRIDTTWWEWPRGPHSVKPAAFLDVVERVSPGPYVELFARAPRLGWDSWGYGYEESNLMVRRMQRRIVGRRLDPFHECRCRCQWRWSKRCGPCVWCGR